VFRMTSCRCTHRDRSGRRKVRSPLANRANPKAHWAAARLEVNARQNAHSATTSSARATSSSRRSRRNNVDVAQRGELAEPDVQREHEHRWIRLGREGVVDQPARLLSPLSHGGLVLGEVVDEPGGPQPRRGGRRATRRQCQRQLPDQQRQREHAQQPPVARALRERQRRRLDGRSTGLDFATPGPGNEASRR